MILSVTVCRRVDPIALQLHIDAYTHTHTLETISSCPNINQKNTDCSTKMTEIKHMHDNNYSKQCNLPSKTTNKTESNAATGKTNNGTADQYDIVCEAQFAEHTFRWKRSKRFFWNVYSLCSWSVHKPSRSYPNVCFTGIVAVCKWITFVFLSIRNWSLVSECEEPKRFFVCVYGQNIVNWQKKNFGFVRCNRAPCAYVCVEKASIAPDNHQSNIHCVRVYRSFDCLYLFLLVIYSGGH